jgi:uncharacterized glyoxalase superfamily protein PhnB
MEMDGSLIIQLLEYAQLNDSEFVDVVDFARDCLEADINDRVGWHKAYQKARHHVNLAHDIGHVMISESNPRGHLHYRLTWSGHKALGYIVQNGKLPD